MIKRLIPFFLLLTGAYAQQPSAYVPQLITYPGIPFGVCQIYQFAENVSNGNFYSCLIVGGAPNGTWQLAGGGGGGSVGGGIINDILAATGLTTSAFVAQGLPLGNGGAPVAACPYTVKADTTTTTVDRGTVLVFNSASACAITLLDPGTTGMGSSFALVLENIGAGTVTVSRQTSATFTVVTGSGAPTVGATSFTLTQSQFATLNSDNGTNWYVRETTGGGGSGTINSCGAAGNAYYGASGTTVSCDTSAVDNGSGTITAVALATSGSNGGITGTEGTGAALTAGAGTDLLWPDSTAHAWKANLNNGGPVTLVTTPSTINVDITTNALAQEAATLAAGYTVGNLACITASNTVGNCATVGAALSSIGVLLAKNGSLPVYASTGTVSVNSHASVVFTAGDIVCSDPSNAGVVVDNGVTPCGLQEQIGTVKTTDGAGSLTHTIILLAAGGSTGGGLTQVSSLPATCTAGTAAPVQLTTTNGIYAPGVIYYCDSTNHYSPVSQGSGAGPIMGIYLGPQCPPSNSSYCYYSPANTQQANDCGWSSAGTTVTCATSHFVAADTGKRAWGFANCEAFIQNQSYGNAIQQNPTPVYTITYASPTTVTLSANPYLTQSGTTGCFIWGNPDDTGTATGAAAIDTLLAAGASTLPFCPKIFLAAAYYMFTTPHFFTNPAACSNLGVSYQGQLGNIFYTGGLEVEGRGASATTIFITPGFPETGACNHGPDANACFAIPLEGRWSDFGLTQGYGPVTNVSTGFLIYAQGPAELERINCTNWATNVAGLVGIGMSTWAQLQQVVNSGCGTVGYATDSIGGSWPNTSVTAFRISSENSQSAGLLMQTGDAYSTQNMNGAAFNCYDCRFEVAQNVNTMQFIGVKNTGGGTINLIRSQIQDNNVTSSGAFPPIGYECLTTAGCTLRLDKSRVMMNNSYTTETALKCVVTCYNYLQNSFLSAGATGNTYIDGVSGSGLWDQGGNTLGSSQFSLTGQVYGEANSSNQSPLVTGNITLSANWGTGHTQTVFLGGDFPAGFTITNGSSATGASPTIALVFPTPLPVAPFSCTATQIGGTNATGTFTSSALSKTGVTFTFSLTPTASATEIVYWNCVTQ